MDEFAQTRGADDLFDDDFTPIGESATQSIRPEPRPAQRGGHTAPTPVKGNRVQDSFVRQAKQKLNLLSAENHHNALKDETPERSTIPPEEVDQSANSKPETPQTPQTQQRPANNAVRGDRTATGGTPKPKLTEEELSARLAAAKLNNAKRAEAHRIAEADEASFQQREAHASQKRKEEGQAKRIMNMEREKNRLRKLGAQAGREWDEGKEEVERSDERGGQYRRGAHGGVLYEGGRGGRNRGYQDRGFDQQHDNYNPHFQTERGYRGRGRGDRGRSRGRGRGRSQGHRGFDSSDEIPQTLPDPVADFPALPNATSGRQSSHSKPSDNILSPVVGASWADEVQASNVREET